MRLIVTVDSVHEMEDGMPYRHSVTKSFPENARLVDVLTYVGSVATSAFETVVAVTLTTDGDTWYTYPPIRDLTGVGMDIPI